MSHGPGTRQRTILAALAEHPWCTLASLLGHEASRAEYSAMQRAAHQLSTAGAIEVYRQGPGVLTSDVGLWLCRPGETAALVQRIGARYTAVLGRHGA